MINICKLTGEEVLSRRNAPTVSLNRKIKKALSPRPFDAVAFAAVLEVLG